MSEIRLVTVFGDRLNLNGDQANLFVLQQRLKWLGFGSEVISVASAKELASAQGHFVLLGHGSRAAWASCDGEWPTLVADVVAACQTTRGLAVGSGASRVALELEGEQKDQTISEFAVDELDGELLLGYKFSEIANAQTRRFGFGLMTWLHGPILAKNPALADSFIVDILNAAGLAAPESLSNENTRKIDEILAGVWQLEKPQN